MGSKSSDFIFNNLDVICPVSFSTEQRVGWLAVLQIFFFPPNYFKLFSLVSKLLMRSQIASRGKLCPIQELNESLRVNLFVPRCWSFPGPASAGWALVGPPRLPLPARPRAPQLLCVPTGWREIRSFNHTVLGASR